MDRVTQERDELADDLKATLAARRELGPEMDDELAETATPDTRKKYVVSFDLLKDGRTSGSPSPRIMACRNFSAPLETLPGW